MRRLSLALVAVLLAALAIAPSAAASNHTGGVNIPINFASAGGTFDGNFELERFVRQGGDLVAVGDLTGTVRNAAGAVVGTVNQALELDVLQITGTCEILNLVLGPLDLDLLGLVIHLDQVVLNITAESGPGNLLGNLLCAVAGLLDGGGPLAGITALLNRILRLLG